LHITNPGLSLIKLKVAPVDVEFIFVPAEELPTAKVSNI